MKEQCAIRKEESCVIVTRITHLPLYMCLNMLGQIKLTLPPGGMVHSSNSLPPETIVQAHPTPQAKGGQLPSLALEQRVEGTENLHHLEAALSQGLDRFSSLTL